uniref:Uncharacterized protein n=1 Tax=Candidatus Kentrum sp. TC TaxID=2126339 RepID=A0A450YQS4_9GAMM|nr:MAG: hypothetical protein BECKTC1821D_GA0114238_10195 [Candidatus Kentron sp. TC]
MGFFTIPISSDLRGTILPIYPLLRSARSGVEKGREIRVCAGHIPRQSRREVLACSSSDCGCLNEFKAKVALICLDLSSLPKFGAKGLMRELVSFDYWESTLAQSRLGGLRRWIMLIYVGWLPQDFTVSRSWPFSSSRDYRLRMPISGLSRSTPV